MTDADIVERLHMRAEIAPDYPLMQEAAAEIEHLREYVDALRLAATSHEPEVLRLQAEIERLGALAAIVREQGIELTDLRAEIERLTAENEDLRRWKALDKPITAAMGIAQAEIERLRAALAEAQDLLSDGPGGPRRITAMKVIRRALEPKS